MLKFLISVFVLLLAGKSYAEGFDNTEYDLYKETQFANGFALIKDSYGKRLSPQHDEKNYADGIMHASVLFGEMDLLNIKKQVIEKMDDSDIKKDEEGIWRPLYDGVRKSHGHQYDALYGWVYWLIFNPQADYSVIGAPQTDYLVNMAILTAISCADVPYWHNKIFACMTQKLPPEQQTTYQTSWISATDECQAEYATHISKMSADIYQKLKVLPQYQKDNR